MGRATRVLTIALAGIVIAGSAWAGITGSKHDLRTTLGISEICVVCHAPHNAVDAAASGLTYSPLWNHEVTTATFTLYNSATLDHTPGQPDGVTKLCLSCHDGSVAIDNYGGVTTGTNFVTGSARLGTDLSNDHPVSFLYDAVASADNGIQPSTNPTPIGGTIASELLVAGKVQCSSCHDVHDRDGNQHLLVINNAASSLCLTCHVK